MRIAPEVFISTTPTITCDEDGVLMSNQLGDTLHSWRCSRHRGLNIAALIVAAVGQWEREQTHREVVVPFANTA